MIPKWRAADRLQPSQILYCARQERAIGIADVELIPTRDVAAASLPDQELQPDTKPFDESGHANDVLGHLPTAAVLLGPKLLDSAHMTAIPVDDRPAEQTVEAPFAASCVVACWRVHHEPGMARIQRRSACSTVAAPVSPNVRSTLTGSLKSRT